MTNFRVLTRGLPALAAAFVAAGPALAHHPLGGQEMTTFGHGLLSGIGHPILGFDHLFFVVAVGLAALFTSRPLVAPLAYVAAMVIGAGLSAMGLGLPMAETAIVVSLLAVGGMLASGYRVDERIVLPAFALFGLFHGTAFGGALAAQESVSIAVSGGYLIGLAAIQWAIAAGAGMLVKTIWKAADTTAIHARLTGAAVAGVGALLALEALEGAVFAALGIGA